MRYLVLGSSLRGLDDVARLANEQGHDVALFDAENAGAPEDLQGRVDVLPVTWDPTFLDGVDRIVTTPWFAEIRPPITDALSRGVEVITEAGFGLERLDTPRIAITGTNGKTTVTEVTTAMLVASDINAIAAGNIGAPTSSVQPGDADILVLELSSYQLRFIGALEPIAVGLLNIAEDHLDWHGSMEAYVDAKAAIVADARPNTVLAYNADDPIVSQIAENSDCDIVKCSGRFVPPGGNGVDGNRLVVNGMVFETAVTSEAYRFDLVVAATLALAGGATRDGIGQVTMSFSPGRHRRERVGVVGGVVFVNDSKATNPHAALAAAGEFESVVLLVGGRNKGLELEPLTTIPSVKTLIAFGESGPQIASIASESVYVASGLEAAVERAVQIAEPGDTVLLSPGCASFDEFVSYEARGDAFRALVETLQGVAA